MLCYLKKKKNQKSNFCHSALIVDQNDAASSFKTATFWKIRDLRNAHFVISSCGNSGWIRENLSFYHSATLLVSANQTRAQNLTCTSDEVHMAPGVHSALLGVSITADRKFQMKNSVSRFHQVASTLIKYGISRNLTRQTCVQSIAKIAPQLSEIIRHATDTRTYIRTDTLSLLKSRPNQYLECLCDSYMYIVTS